MLITKNIGKNRNIVIKTMTFLIIGKKNNQSSVSGDAD